MHIFKHIHTYIIHTYCCTILLVLTVCRDSNSNNLPQQFALNNLMFGKMKIQVIGSGPK